MKEKIRIFLDTDLLEKYLLGKTDIVESARVERYIAMYPEVRASYNELQANLEAFARLHALETPQGLKETILGRIRAQNFGKRRFRRYAIAASIVAMMFAGSSYFFWDQNKMLQEENAVVTNKIRGLQEDLQEQLEDVRNQFIVLNNPETKKYPVKGNKKAKELKAIAYINPVKKLSYINVENLPNLPKDKCYQMWAEVNGEMVNLGVLKNFGEDRLKSLPYAEHALSYITIEPKGGNDTPSVQNIVANFTF